MNILNLLSASQAWGGFATFMIFVVSFVVVHAVKLSTKGYDVYRNEAEREKEINAEQEPQQTSSLPPKQEPVPIYYLVEKKRVRKKNTTEYAEPKRIRFSQEERR